MELVEDFGAKLIIIVKFHWKHGQTTGLQSSKTESEMAAITKNSKNNKIKFFSISRAA